MKEEKLRRQLLTTASSFSAPLFRSYQATSEEKRCSEYPPMVMLAYFSSSADRPKNEYVLFLS